MEDDRADVPAGERKAFREEVEVQIAGIDALGARLAWFAPSDLGEIALGPLAASGSIDAGGLRALIAEALVGHVLDAYSAPQAEEGATEQEGTS